MTNNKNWLLYGATGYSGERVAREAVKRGYQPVISGRNEAKVRQLAEELGLQWQCFEVTDQQAVQQAMVDVDVLLNCAGPFLNTWQPLFEACLETGTHYLDITGEVDVYEALIARHQEALNAGVVAMSGVGFDMVPGDCLANMLQSRLPDGNELHIGYSFDGTLTQGSIRSALASFSPDSKVRRNNQITRLEQPLTRSFDFGNSVSDAEVECLATTFGDISIAGWSTQIANITSYLHFTQAFQKLVELDSEEKIVALPQGPSETELLNENAMIVAELFNEAGESCKARMTTPQVYAATFPLAAKIAERLCHETIESGFQTAAAVFGNAFVLEFDGYEIEWL